MAIKTAAGNLIFYHSGSRQSEMKDCPASGAGSRPQTTAMRLYDPPAYG
jgi:hypothetical protein